MAVSALAVSLAACSTSGTTRLAGIGAGSGDNGGGTGSGTGGTGGTGTGGDTGTGSGGFGSGGGTGSGGSGSGGSGGGGSGTGTGGTLAGLPIGSITGSTGVADTGVLPNVGQASQTSPLAPVLVAAGNGALGLPGVTNSLNGGVPAANPLAAVGAILHH